MDWKDVAAKVVSLGAPMLGSALGGPLGGMAGKVLADAFGAAAATPEAVHAAISDKAADLKLAAEAAQKAESEWMSARAKSQAARKLARLKTRIGYPDRWRDYRGFVVKRDDLIGNVERALRFENDRRMALVSDPQDRGEWIVAFHPI